jgi:hypothetical protein
MHLRPPTGKGRRKAARINLNRARAFVIGGHPPGTDGIRESIDRFINFGPRAT